ncbi:MAG: hypothetical protein ACRDH6_07835 [Actinomycetota bacterium]
MTTLAGANLGLLALLVAHDLDHVFNQAPRDLAVQVIATGLVGITATIVVLVLALRRQALAAPASVLVGFGNAVGFTAVHLAPHWSAFSDPYPTLDLNPLSWLLIAAPMVAGIIVGVQGLRALRPARA